MLLAYRAPRHISHQMNYFLSGELWEGEAMLFISAASQEYTRVQWDLLPGIRNVQENLTPSRGNTPRQNTYRTCTWAMVATQPCCIGSWMTMLKLANHRYPYEPHWAGAVELTRQHFRGCSRDAVRVHKLFRVNASTSCIAFKREQAAYACNCRQLLSSHKWFVFLPACFKRRNGIYKRWPSDVRAVVRAREAAVLADWQQGEVCGNHSIDFALRLHGWFMSPGGGKVLCCVCLSLHWGILSVYCARSSGAHETRKLLLSWTRWLLISLLYPALFGTTEWLFFIDFRKAVHAGKWLIWRRIYWSVFPSSLVLQTICVGRKN